MADSTVYVPTLEPVVDLACAEIRRIASARLHRPGHWRTEVASTTVRSHSVIRVIRLGDGLESRRFYLKT
ncbi:MAG: hypothetical protein ACREJG_02460, partial [Candidatus Rokuibacteriota bacterium]